MWRSKRTTANFVPSEFDANETDKNPVINEPSLNTEDTHSNEMEDSQPVSNGSERRAWTDDISSDEDDFIETIDADGNIVKKKGDIQQTQVWFLDVGLKFVVNFNKYKQPIGKGGHVLVKFLGEVAIKGSLCPIGEISWHKVHKTYKVEIVKLVRKRFHMPKDLEIDQLILSHVNLKWRTYKSKLKREYFNPNKTEQQIANKVPSNVIRDQWVCLVSYWFSPAGKKLAAIGKRSREQKVQCHTTGSKSFAQIIYEFEKKHKRPPSMLEVWKLTHLKKDGSFVENTNTKEFMEVAENLVNERVMSHPDMPKELIEDAVFEELMYDEESPNQRVVGYGHGVSRNQVFGLKADLRRYNIGDDCMDVEVKQKLFSLEKENKQLKDAYTNLQSSVCQMASALARNGIVLDDPTFGDDDGNDIDDYEERDMDSLRQNMVRTVGRQNLRDQDGNIRQDDSDKRGDNNRRYLHEVIQPFRSSTSNYRGRQEANLPATHHSETQRTVDGEFFWNNADQDGSIRQDDSDNRGDNNKRSFRSSTSNYRGRQEVNHLATHHSKTQRTVDGEFLWNNGVQFKSRSRSRPSNSLIRNLNCHSSYFVRTKRILYMHLLFFFI